MINGGECEACQEKGSGKGVRKRGQKRGQRKGVRKRFVAFIVRLFLTH